MAKTYNDKGYFGKQNYLTKQAERYGIDLGKYEVNGNNSGREWGPDLKSMADLENEVARNMSMDYDVREAIAAGSKAGNKRLADLGDGISNIHEAFAATKAMQKYHKKDLGNGGNFSSANDYSNVSSALNREYEQYFKEDILKDVYDNMPKQEGSDDDDDSTNIAGPSYIDSFGLDQEIAKATSGYNTDGTPIDLNPTAFLSKAVKDIVYGPQGQMDKAHNNQDQYALSFEDSDLKLNPSAINNQTTGLR